MVDASLSDGEVALLAHGLTDDVALVWALIELGFRGNPPVDNSPPSPEVIASAFATFEKLVALGLIAVGRTEYRDPDQVPGTVGPVQHVSEPLDEVRARVERACTQSGEWEFSCWLVNTDKGDEVARQRA